MTFEELKKAVLDLSKEDQKRLIIEVIPEIWPMACTDDACLLKMREIVDEETVKNYRNQHMNSL